jgi:hypothetical protein
VQPLEPAVFFDPPEAETPTRDGWSCSPAYCSLVAATESTSHHLS